MSQTEIVDGLLSRMSRDVFIDSYVKRIESVHDGVQTAEWFLTLEYPTEICLGTSMSMTLNVFKLLKALQLLSQKTGRIGLHKNYQRPLEIEQHMRHELTEMIHTQLNSKEVEAFIKKSPVDHVFKIQTVD